MEQNRTLRSEIISKNRTVRSYEVFMNTLEKQKNQELPEPILVLGNTNSGIELTVLTSLYCGMCKELTDIIGHILFAYEDEVKINILFKTQPVEERNQYLYILHSVFLTHGSQEFMKAMYFWFKHKNLAPWFIDTGYNIEETKTALHQSNQWFAQQGIISTPSIFINGYEFPVEYDKEDLYYYIEGIIENNK
ncbi:DsbA family protein [Chryseobacterium pennipullorum]|nr:thioredoxin domain-containing protein [Chryseobacterium pennipullorum]